MPVALAGAQGKRVFGNVEAWLVPSDVTNQLYHADMQNNVLFIFVPQMMYRNQRLTVTFSILSCLAHERKPRFLSAGNRDFRWPAGFVRKVVGKRSLRIFGRYCLNIVIVMY